MSAIVRLHALDPQGRSRANAVFRATSRKNDALCKRQRGYRLLAADGVDFGSQSFWLCLPVGSSQGVIAGPFAWSAVYCPHGYDECAQGCAYPGRCGEVQS